MSRLEVRFPDSWAVLDSGSTAQAARSRLVETVESELGASEGDAVTEYLKVVTPVMADIGVNAFASLALLSDASLIQAWCAIVVAPRTSADPGRQLLDVAEGGPHPGLDRETIIVELALGNAVRSSAFRFAEELLDDDGIAPYAAEVRFAFALPGDRIGVLHFETLSLVYYDELTALFDAIAATALMT